MLELRVPRREQNAIRRLPASFVSRFQYGRSTGLDHNYWGRVQEFSLLAEFIESGNRNYTLEYFVERLATFETYHDYLESRREFHNAREVPGERITSSSNRERYQWVEFGCSDLSRIVGYEEMAKAFFHSRAQRLNTLGREFRELAFAGSFSGNVLRRVKCYNDINFETFVKLEREMWLLKGIEERSIYSEEWSERFKQLLFRLRK